MQNAKCKMQKWEFLGFFWRKIWWGEKFVITLHSQLRDINCVTYFSGALVQLVRMPACHAGGRWFESCTHRKKATFRIVG